MTDRIHGMSSKHKSLPVDPRTTEAGSNSKAGAIRFIVLFTILVAAGSASEVFILRCQNAGVDDRTALTEAAAGWSTAYQRTVASGVTTCLHAMGVPVRLTGTTLWIRSSRVEVAVECTGVRATAIFCAGVLAFPCAFRRKLIGLIIGLLGVGALNMARITTLTLVSGYRHDWFDQVHAVLMQGFLIRFVAPLWVLWMLRARPSAAARQPAVRT